MFNQSTLAAHINNSPAGNTTPSWKVIDNIAFDMETVYLWIILAVGVPGNCATIITVTKMSPAKSLTVYIALLALVDNLAIITKLLVFVLPDNKIHIERAGCKILGYLGNFLSTFSNWLLVALSIERFAAVWLPMRVAQTWTFRKSTIIVCLIATLLALIFLHLFWTMTFVNDTEAKMMYCSARDEYKFFLQNIWYWINVMIYATLPCILLLIFNILIIVGIVRAQRLHTYLEGSEVESKSVHRERHRQVTIMLVTAAITLVILTTPRCVMLILSPYYDPPEGTLAGSVYFLIDTFAFVLCDFTHAINFYVYSLSAKKFRCQFLELILCRKQSAKNVSQYFSLTTRHSVRKTAV